MKEILETIIFSVGMGFINLYFQKYQLNYLRPYIFHIYILVSLMSPTSVDTPCT